MSNYKINFGGKKAKPLFEKKVDTPVIDYGDGQPDIEHDAKTELTQLRAEFREKAKKEQELKAKNTSSEFWSCIVFQDQEQRDRFFQLMGITEPDNQYINGLKLIKALELKMDSLETSQPGKFKVNRDILKLSIKPDFLT